MRKIEEFSSYLKEKEEFKEKIVYSYTLSPKKEKTSSLLLSPLLKEALPKVGINHLYLHQVQALKSIREGKNVMVCTPTASGKTLIYNISVAESLLKDSRRCALYIFPLKALARDQSETINELNLALGGHNFGVAVYDGGTTPYQRQKIRKNLPQILLTNPDMLHLSLLPYHHLWKKFFSHLQYVILDETHSYSGVFGSQVGNVIRRLRRISHFYGSSPQFIASSATMANPSSFIRKLVGKTFQTISQSYSPSSSKEFLFYSPLRSPYREAKELLVECVKAGLKTIVFTKARKITELIYTWILKENPSLSSLIVPYRAGYLPEDRRETERKLFREELLGVIATSALELGIDIGGLDVCILVGYPGSIISFWQRAGRVGRKNKGLVFFIPLSNSLDHYFLLHPEQLFKGEWEEAIIDVFNERIWGKHLICAASENPLRKKEPVYEKDSKKVIHSLSSAGKIFLTRQGDRWISNLHRPQRKVNIRSIGETFIIINKRRVLETIEYSRAFFECHPGAIFLHQGKQYRVTSLNIKEREIDVERVNVNYYTQTMSTTELEEFIPLEQKESDGFQAILGKAKVKEQVEGYSKRDILGRGVLGEYSLDLPPQVFKTISLGLKVSSLPRIKDLAGGLHAIEHAICAMFPLFCLCARKDIGGVSYPLFPQWGVPAIFIYDGYPGGVGLSRKGYEVVDKLLEKVFKLIKDCECESDEGCPYCIQSPRCGNGNKPLSKESAIRLLEYILRKIKTSQLTSKRDGIKDKVKNKVHFLSPEKKIYIFDLETQKLAQEVGGWDNSHLLRLSCAVIFDEGKGNYKVYLEKDVKRLLCDLKEADLVVGFNNKRFDWKVLSYYTDFDLQKIPSLDILNEVEKKLNYRLSLDHLAQTTLGKGKIANGIQAVSWFRQGRIDKVIKYCKHDVAITKGLFEFGKKNGYLLFKREGNILRLPVDWEDYTHK
ncbi:MAG: DEAD/DEAH box helicase [Candidatus Aerophobetes bacterium]|nr:DEAD/DEAH box helicase [Candidatus Aerophobetes bacterium]